MTDVLSGMEKSRAIPLLIRTMAPQVVAADEIGGAKDAAALLCALRCGVTVLATAHGGSLEGVAGRPGMRELLREGAFQRIVLLRAPGTPPRVLTPEGGALPCGS